MMLKRFLIPLLTCLLLCGCAADSAVPETSLPAETETIPAATESLGLYDAGSAMEAKTNGAVRTYPLYISDPNGLRSMGDSLLLFSGTEAETTITRLYGDELNIAAETTLDFPLAADAPSLYVTDSGISYYDPVNCQTVVLDSSLKEVSHIAAPEDLVGSPILSADRNTLYYCTSSAIRAWNLETGIRRVVKEMTFPYQSITGLHLNDTVLQCSTTDSDGTIRTLLLSAENGRLLYEGEDLTMVTSGDSYCISFPAGITQTLLFGQGDRKPQALTPVDLAADCRFLIQQQGAVGISCPSDSALRLDYYDLTTGCRSSVLTLNSGHYPTAISSTADGYIFILVYDPAYGYEVLYRWDTFALASNDATVYTGTYYTADSPDYHGLVACQSYADRIGSKYGIEVLVWEDALAVQPWDYDFEMEYLVPVLQQELELLDQRLSHYPEGVLQTTASHFGSLKICLVRQITGTAESGSLDIATGVQFFDGTDAYIALAVGSTSEKSLYHELYHVMETHILTDSIAFDQWSKLNPVGFEYDYDYRANAQRDGSEYLQDATRSFIDTYSMSFPKEDRARIMEFAMTEGNEDYFASSPMQFKLRTLCQGIREAYGLEKSEESFLWEQYLKISLY